MRRVRPPACRRVAVNLGRAFGRSVSPPNPADARSGPCFAQSDSDRVEIELWNVRGPASLRDVRGAKHGSRPFTVSEFDSPKCSPQRWTKARNDRSVRHMK